MSWWYIMVRHLCWIWFIIPISFFVHSKSYLNLQVLTGTNGVIRWTLGSADLVLSIMWAVPYNRQFYRSWVAVGLTSHTNLPTYKEMYSKKDDSRFTRRQAGQRFEFSTAGGKFIVIAEMDGDATFKPVLRVSLIPKDEDLLGSNIRLLYNIFELSF